MSVWSMLFRMNHAKITKYGKNAGVSKFIPVYIRVPTQFRVLEHHKLLFIRISTT